MSACSKARECALSPPRARVVRSNTTIRSFSSSERKGCDSGSISPSRGTLPQIVRETDKAGNAARAQVSKWPISEVAARLIEVRSLGHSGLDLLT